MKTRQNALIHRALALMLLGMLTACAMGPDYQRPEAPTPTQFKEIGEWQLAQPADDQIRDRWWEIYQDPVLDELVAQVAVSNQNIVVASAQYKQALATLGLSEANLYPVLGATLTGTKGRTAESSISSTNTNAGPTYQTTKYNWIASWEPDFWGSVSRTVESNKASAQASLAQVQLTLLSTQATLVQTYLQLRASDVQQKLLNESVQAYERSLEITRNRLESGVAAQLDVVQAQTQLESTRAQALDINITRQQLEHAIALLVGKAPSEFSITPTYQVPGISPIPVSLPATLLQRRPDIASAERRVAAANAQIGVAKAAFFPSLTFNFAGGYQGNNGMSQLFSVPNKVWSFGPQLGLGILDGGARFAQRDYSNAAFEAAVASYRQTVLSAFQEIEDNLAAIRQLDQEEKAQALAVKSAQNALEITQNQYMAGTVSYLNVVTAQTTALTARVTYNTILSRRLVAHAVLLKAMGGNWVNQG